MKKKRDFWDMSWNPVWGCLNNCPFCYARKIAWRYSEQIAKKEISYLSQFGIIYDIQTKLEKLTQKLKHFQPVWLESNYVRSFPKKPNIIFVNSMSDPAYWEHEWYEKIVQRIAGNMQHTFVILTKKPQIYKFFKFPHNTILGLTITKNSDIEKLKLFLLIIKSNPVLLSFEPIQEKMNMNINNLFVYGIDWIHIGEESGNRKGQIQATKEMIQPIYDLKEIPVFMKNNLERLYPGKLRKEFPVLT